MMLLCVFCCRLIFSPVWLFHAVVARGRFSLPAPSMPHGRYVRWIYSTNSKIISWQHNLFCLPWSVPELYNCLNTSIDSGHRFMPLWLLLCLLLLNFSFVYILRGDMVNFLIPHMLLPKDAESAKCFFRTFPLLN